MAKPRRFFRPAWADVNLDALAFNARRLRARLPAATDLLFVVKANAYGHGLLESSRAARDRDLCDFLGVSSVEEGLAIRGEGVRLPTLILGSLYPFESFSAAMDAHLIPTIASLDAARTLKLLARRRRSRVECHLKLETGMNRIGVTLPTALAIARELRQDPFVRISGAYTQLSSAGSDRAYTRRQLQAFAQGSAALERALGHELLLHAANSEAALRHPESRLGMVRSGLALYGLLPGFRPVMSLRCRIVFLKIVAEGSSVSYGRTFTAKRRTVVATLPMGYGDGIPRALSNKGHVLIRGRRCPIIGQVAMDMAMIDATEAPGVQAGDEAVFLGGQGASRIAVSDWARLLGMSPYEIVCAIQARVPRLAA